MTNNNIETYYNRGREQDRLTRETGKLELARTQEIILRYLPKPPLTVMDIGGGAGIYALWLAALGYSVHLVDMMPLHVEQALKASENQPGRPLASAEVGNALGLDFDDASADAVLLFGPLYHLPARADRIKALREAYRILKPGGLVFTASISRFASFLDGLTRFFLADPYFAKLVERDLVDGQHRNDSNQPGYFTTAFFHHPDEIRAEVAEAGFQVEASLAVEGMAGFLPDFDRYWDDDVLRERLLDFLRTIESEPSMLGATGHLLTVGKKE